MEPNVWTTGLIVAVMLTGLYCEDSFPLYLETAIDYLHVVGRLISVSPHALA